MQSLVICISISLSRIVFSIKWSSEANSKWSGTWAWAARGMSCCGVWVGMGAGAVYGEIVVIIISNIFPTWISDLTLVLTGGLLMFKLDIFCCSTWRSFLIFSDSANTESMAGCGVACSRRTCCCWCCCWSCWCCIWRATTRNKRKCLNGAQSLQGRRINRIKSLNFKRYLDHYFRTSLMTCRYQDRQCIQFLHLNQLSPVEAWLCHHFVGSTKPLVEFAKTFALSAEQLALD